ncbi:MAG TPA: TonB-dependent receptor [Cytophagaceae bacterium]|nr:TonB-dependent receptor [Cytophagaceae bacterium]
MMNKKAFLLLILLSCFTLPSFAQKFTLSGTIKDSATGEAMIGAAIYVKEIKNGVATNDYGFFSISLPAGKYTLVITTLGYNKYEKVVNLNSNTTLNIDMSEEVVSTEEIVVTGERADKNVQDTKMSNIQIDVKQIKKLPALFGEIDIIKNIQMMPGISVAGEGNTGLYVRGGSADQNLILMDEAPVYNPSHLFGIFSIFNSDALKSAEIYKGGIPAQYGGRLSSLLDIRTKDGNAKKLAASGGIGLISSRLTVQGPIVKDKCSFIVSGRRTYADMFVKLANQLNILSADQKKSTKNAKLYFYDLNAKINYKINDKNQVFLAGYFGKDVLQAGGVQSFALDWSNATGTLRWNHIYGRKLFSNTTLIYSNYNYGLGITSGAQGFRWAANLKEVALKQDYTYFLTPNNELTYGFNVSYKSYSPGNFTPGDDNTSFKAFKLQPYHSIDEAIFLSNKQKFSNRISVEYGLRYTMFQNIGKDTVINYNGQPDAKTATDTVFYNSFKVIKNYGGLEPRISGRYLLNEKSSVKASYNRTYQFLHLLYNSAAPLPTSQWIPSTPYIKPQKADQFALGYFRNFRENKFEASVEGYYKYFYNVLDFKDNANIIANKNIETEIRRGKGWSYGLEFFLRKNTGRFTGWISYTWSKTQFKIPDINEGRPYYASYDRRNNINVVGSYDVSKRLNISGNWVFGSGKPITLPVQKYQYGNNYPVYIPERNNYRIAPYHRFDISATLYRKQKEGRKNQSSWNFSIYNFYSRKNPFTVYTRDQQDSKGNSLNNGQKEVVMLYLFTIIPSVTYNFSF